MNQTAWRENAVEAFAEIRTCRMELRAFLTGMFDRLDDVAAELLSQRVVGQTAAGRSEQGAMQNQIDELTRIVADLAQSMAEQKRPGVRPQRVQPRNVEVKV